MIDLKKLQDTIFNNKMEKGFNTTDIHKEFCFIYEELAEANRAYYRKETNIGEELADVTIFLLGLSEMLGINLENEIRNKIKINEKRKYINNNGVNTKL
ncbi:MAG: MazG-like family protein [Candidatus Gracilibacteria bacterium]|nr:MazG-like family protein [Candidatus Gracilibacteria bacterium]